MNELLLNHITLNYLNTPLQMIMFQIINFYCNKIVHLDFFLLENVNDIEKSLELICAEPLLKQHINVKSFCQTYKTWKKTINEYLHFFNITKVKFEEFTNINEYFKLIYIKTLLKCLFESNHYTVENDITKEINLFENLIRKKYSISFTNYFNEQMKVLQECLNEKK